MGTHSQVSYRKKTTQGGVMQIDLRNVRTRWINVDKDEDKARQMNELLDGLGFTNHERFSAVTGIAPHEGVRRGEEHYRNCAESHFKILEETILADGEPVLILEDDVDTLRDAIVFEFPVPESTDCIYLGVSTGDGSFEAIDQKNGWAKIQRVFATHAILHLSKEMSQDVIDFGKKFIYENNTPFDVGLAYEVQPRYNVLTPYVPFFYQADSKNTVNKWEHLTINPLPMKQKFRIGTMK